MHLFADRGLWTQSANRRIEHCMLSTAINVVRLSLVPFGQTVPPGEFLPSGEIDCGMIVTIDEDWRVDGWPRFMLPIDRLA